MVTAEWPDQRFSLAAKNLKDDDCQIDCKRGTLKH